MSLTGFRKNAILLYFKKPFKLACFWNDLFFGSYALYTLAPFVLPILSFVIVELT